MGENGRDIWEIAMGDMHSTLIFFDGVWLESNEATGLCDGECSEGKVPEVKGTDEFFLEVNDTTQH
jgi:hypothetical protein